MSLRPRETHSLPPLQRLAERCQPCAPTEKRYESLAYARFDNILQPGNWTTCAICLAELAGPAHALPGHSVATVVLKKTCGHVFHVECLRDWARAHLECPLCRTPMDPAERQELLPTLEELYADVRRLLLTYIDDVNAGGYEDWLYDINNSLPSSAPLIAAVEAAFATEKGLEELAPSFVVLDDGPKPGTRPRAIWMKVSEIVVWFGFVDLVAEYVDPDYEEFSNPYYTPLMAASGRGHLAVVNALLAAGADPSYHQWGRKYKTWTALMWASRHGHADVVARKLTSTKGLRIKDPDLKTRTFVDGNNLMMQQRVTKGRDNLTRKIAGVKSREVIVVFDGRPGEPESRVGADPEVVVTQGGGEGGGSRMTADFWIDSQLRAGDEVVTAGGLVGKITKVEDHFVHVELAKGMTVKAVRNTIGEVLSSRDKPAAND